MRHNLIYMANHVEHLDNVLKTTGEKVLQGAGIISHAQTIEKETEEYRKYQMQNLSPVEEDSTIRDFRIVQTEDSRQVTRDMKHYNLRMIIAVSFKVDDERLKNGGSVLTIGYFDCLLEQIWQLNLKRSVLPIRSQCSRISALCYICRRQVGQH